MALPYAFSNNTAPTGVQLDADLAALGALTPIPCTITGTNTLALTPALNTPTVSAYAQGMQFSGIAAASNSAATTAQVGSLGALPVYRDSPSGPVACVGGEIINGCAFVLLYDSALNAGNGGFHLFATTAAYSKSGGTISGSVVVTGTVASVAYTAMLAPDIATVTSIKASVGTLTQLQVGATAASITRILSSLATLTFTMTPAQVAQSQNIVMPGVQLGDAVAVGATITQAGAVFAGEVPAAGTVGIRMLNGGSASIAAFTATFRAVAIGAA